MRTILQAPSALPILFLFLCVGSSGCNTLNMAAGDLFGGDDAKSLTTRPPGTQGPTVAVEIYPERGKPERAFLPLDSVTYVQDVLDQTNVHRRFSRVKIRVHRQLPDGGGHKFDVHYNRKSRSIEPAFDYALHPGDRLQIIEDPTNTFDDILGSVSGQIGGGLPF